MYSESQLIPVVILIFDNEGQITYKAYSPNNYDVDFGDALEGAVIVSNDESFEHKFGQFLARVYNRVAFDSANSLNNSTCFGRLKEIHTRRLNIPVNMRGETCYFTTYTHIHTSYNPIHHTSPVLFNENDALLYANSQPNLLHCRCEHECL
jgi:hypothetical protein